MDGKGIWPSSKRTSQGMAVEERKVADSLQGLDINDYQGEENDDEYDDASDSGSMYLSPFLFYQTADTDSERKSTKSFEAQNIHVTVEHGRRYCDESYFMPNDETESIRLNIIHQIYLMLLDGKLTTVPLAKDEPRILDIGTGTGDWAVEMSRLFPKATIIATDIGIFDTGLAHIDLPNVFFQLDDAREGWTYHEPFDLIHLRGLSGAFNDWPAIYGQAIEHNPGGYIEIADTDPAGDSVIFPNSESSYFHIYTGAMRSAAETLGYPRDLSHLKPNMLSAAGFVDVCVFDRTVPIGLWPEDLHEKTLGKLTLIPVLEGLEAYGLRSLTATGWTADAARDLCEKAKMEIMSADRMTARVKFMTGRKPISRIQMKEMRQRELLVRALKNVEE